MSDRESFRVSEKEEEYKLKSRKIRYFMAFLIINLNKNFKNAKYKLTFNNLNPPLNIKKILIN